MPAIEVSCPSCGKIIIIEMKLHKPVDGGFAEFLTKIVGDIGIKHYAFNGEKRCVCGENVDVSINVANSRNENSGRQILVKQLG